MIGRSFSVWGSSEFAAFRSIIVVGLGAVLRCLTPSIFYETPQSFTLGVAADYPFGAPTLVSKEKVFVFHDEKHGVSVASAVCPQLGCTLAYSQDDGYFHCPGHGSVYSAQGKVVQGPTHKPLQWFEVSLTRDGRLEVNEDQVVPSSFRLMA